MRNFIEVEITFIGNTVNHNRWHIILWLFQFCLNRAACLFHLRVLKKKYACDGFFKEILKASPKKP